MSYTLEQLKLMGATPGNQSKSYTSVELQGMGASSSAIDEPIESTPAMGNPLTEIGKGFMKGLGSTVSSIGAGQNSLAANATQQDSPFGKNIESFNTAMKSKNAFQTTGKVIEGVAEMFVPLTGAKKLRDARYLATAPKKILEELTPKLTPSKYAIAGKAGQTSPRTVLEGAKLAGEQLPDAKHSTESVFNVAKALNKKAWDIVKPGRDATTNLNSVRSAIGEYSQNTISPFLSNNKIPTNFGDFIHYMEAVKPNQAIKSSPEAFQVFNRVRDRVIDSIYSSMKTSARTADDFGSITDMNDYWKARQVIDDIIEEELGAKTFTDTGITGVKAAASTLRRGVADFISDTMKYTGQGEKLSVFRHTINGMRERGIDMSSQIDKLAEQLGLIPIGKSIATTWDDMMKNTSGLYKAVDALSTKIGAERNVGKLAQFGRNHPLLMKTGKVAGYSAAGAAGAGAGWNVISGI